MDEGEQVPACSKCQGSGEVDCGGLVIKHLGSYKCCSCLKYAPDQMSIQWAYCCRKVGCPSCQGRQ